MRDQQNKPSSMRIEVREMLQRAAKHLDWAGAQHPQGPLASPEGGTEHKQ